MELDVDGDYAEIYINEHLYAQDGSDCNSFGDMGYIKCENVNEESRRITTSSINP